MGQILLNLVGWLVFIAIIAVLAWILAKLLKARRSSYGWAFLATLLASVVAGSLGYFISSPFINVALDVASGVVIYSLVLDTALAKAAVVYVGTIVVVMATLVLIGIASGHHSVSLTWDGHRYSLYSP
jgi:hypothetical protein